jgi:hypothetical protein
LSYETLAEAKDNFEYLPLDIFVPGYVEVIEKESPPKYTCENCRRQWNCELYRMEKDLSKLCPHRHETHQTELFQHDLHQGSYVERLKDWANRYYPIEGKQERCLRRRIYLHRHIEQFRGKLFEE